MIFIFIMIDVTEISEYIPIVDENGEMLFMSMDLRQKLEDEEEIWHWTPWLRTRTTVLGNVVQEIACLSGDSIDSFPDSILTGVYHIYPKVLTFYKLTLC